MSKQPFVINTLSLHSSTNDKINSHMKKHAAYIGWHLQQFILTKHSMKRHLANHITDNKERTAGSTDGTNVRQ